MSYYRHGPSRPGGTTVTFGVPSLTPIVKLLILINAVAWLATFLLSSLGVPVVTWLGLTPALLTRGAIWQLVTWMFLHAPLNPFHLVFNMLFVWMLGGELERYWGSRAFLRYYLVVGLGSGLFVLAAGLASNPAIPTIGASGAVYGLIVAYGMIFAERRILFMLIFPMKARTFAILLFAFAFFYTSFGRGGNVSDIAHLGGAVIGFLYLKRAWRIGAFYRELRWRLMRRKFKVIPSHERDDSDRWVN